MGDFFGIDRLKKGEDILIWVSDVYRNGWFFFDEEEDYQGVTLWRYDLQMSPELDNATTWAGAANFYQFGPPGVVNMSTCPPGSKDVPSPAFIGKAHFKDSGYVEDGKKLGIAAPSANDDVWIAIEPLSGATFHAKKQLQVNFPINPIPNIAVTQPLAGYEVMYALCYVNEHLELSQKDCDDFSKVYTIQNVAKGFKITGFICLGLIGVILIAALGLKFYRHQTDSGFGKTFSSGGQEVRSSY